MSENAGLQTLTKGSNVKYKHQIEQRIPPTFRVKDRTRVFQVDRSYRALQETMAREQLSLEDLRYSPVTRADKHSMNYEPVGAPRYSEAIRRTFKKNKFRPSVSFIPQTALLENQPALNIADPVYPQLGFNPMEEVPDLSVANNLSENRQMRTSNRRLASLLDTRARERSRARFAMRTINPDAPRIVNVKKHRSQQATLQASQDVTNQKTKELVKKLFRNSSLIQEMD